MTAPTTHQAEHKVFTATDVATAEPPLHAEASGRGNLRGRTLARHPTMSSSSHTATPDVAQADDKEVNNCLLALYACYRCFRICFWID